MGNVVYRVQAPDGTVMRIEGPEGASEDQLAGIAQQHYAAQRAPTTQQRSGIDSSALVDTLKDLPRYALDAARSFGMGAADLALGAGQLASKAMGTEQSERYADAMRNIERDYQEGRESSTPDVGRFTGSVVTGGLATGGTAPAATLGGRMAQGAKIGATLGLASPVDPDSESYGTSKAVQVGGGAVLGGLAPAAVEGIIRVTGATINGLVNSVRGLRNTVGGASNAHNVETALRAQLQGAGVDWSRLPQEARSTLVGEVQKAVRGGGTLDDEATRRLADFLRFKMTPTQGQLTRDPVQFAREVNYSKAEFGRPLAQRFTEENAQLIGAVDDMRAGTGARAGDSFAAGERVISDLRATDAAKKGAIDAAYTRARSLLGMDAEVPAQPVAERLGRIVEEFGSDKIPGAVASRLNEFGMLGGKQTKLLTIREAEKLRTLIGNNIDNPQTPTGKALGLLKDSVDDAVNSLGDAAEGGAGAEAAAAFQKARGLAARRFEALRQTPGLAKAISRDPGAPERFLEAEVIRGDVKDVANLIGRLSKDARSEVRGAVIDWIKGKGVSGVEDAAKFTQAGYNRALQALGERKLEIIFGKAAADELRALGRVGAYVQSPPVASGVNYSNTFTSGLDFLDQATRLPIVNWFTGRPGDMVRAAQSGNALRAVPVQSPSPLLNPGAVDRLAASGGILGIPAAAQTPSILLAKPNQKRIRGILGRPIE